MKFNKTLLAILCLAGLIFTGCASSDDASATRHKIEVYGLAAAPGWTVLNPNISNSATANQTSDFSVIATSGTNDNTGFFTKLLTRPRVYLAYRETWEDKSKGGGTFVLTDPAASQLSFTRANQNGLGGNRSVVIGSLSSTITTNAVSLVTATGSAVGNVVGAAAAAAAK